MPRSAIPIEPNPDRIATRASNANVHPGIAAKEALYTRRPKEVIQREKDEKAERQRDKEQKQLAEKARKIAGEEYLARLEAEEATTAVDEENQYPRQRVQKKGM
jgi:hypothetical protein